MALLRPEHRAYHTPTNETLAGWMIECGASPEVAEEMWDGCPGAREAWTTVQAYRAARFFVVDHEDRTQALWLAGQPPRTLEAELSEVFAEFLALFDEPSEAVSLLRGCQDGLARRQWVHGVDAPDRDVPEACWALVRALSASARLRAAAAVLERRLGR